MGFGFSRPCTQSAAQHQEIIDTLKHDNPDLYARLTEIVEDELKKKYQKAASPRRVPASLAAAIPIGAQSSPSCPSPAPEKFSDKLSDYSFPFENLVFEGGGGKGRIYGGALKCLSDAGIKAKRFGGASAGAMTAALLAVNTPLEEVDRLMNVDLNSILVDHSYGYFSLVPNLLRHFGWNRGDKFLDFFGQIMEDRTGDKDITFEGVYNKFGNELCITGVNTNLQAVEYFHVKTTPTMSVRIAVRMSMSIPGFFAAVPYSTAKGLTDYYVDGGVLCNYPIHVFDGWWLSMKPEDSYYQRIRPLTEMTKLMDNDNRFGIRNEKTLGFLVYASGEEEIMQVDLEKRFADVKVPRPDTALFRKKQEAMKEQQKPLLAHAILIGATDRFFDALRDADISNDNNAQVSKVEFQKVFANLKPKADGDSHPFSLTDAKMLFGKDFDVDQVFDSMDLNKDGVIDFSELCKMLDKSLGFNKRFTGYARREIGSFFEFGTAILDALQLNAKKIYVHACDLERTVGLNTDYIGTMDFTIEPADQQFLAAQSYKTTELFLRDYVKKNNSSNRK